MGDYFRYFDSDGNGELNEDEFNMLCLHMVEVGGYDLNRLNFKIEVLDKDGDGVVTFNEYIVHMIGLGALDGKDGSRPVHG